MISGLNRSAEQRLSEAERDQKERLKVARQSLLSTPEFGVASLVLAFWAIILVPIVGVLFTLIAWGVVFGIGELLLYLTVRKGDHGFLALTAIYTLCVAWPALVVQDWGLPMSLVIAGASALFITDLVRLNFARRRDAVVDASLVTSTLLMTGAVTAMSLFSFSLVLGLADESGNRSWIWMPVISGLLLAVAGVAFFALSRSPAKSKTRNWKPGETMLPPPTL